MPIPSSATIEENGIITVVVNLSGKPVPGIASFVRLDGVEIPRREDRIIINGNAIIIRNLAREDEGMYNITVSNNVASTVALFQLIVPCESTVCLACTSVVCLHLIIYHNAVVCALLIILPTDSHATSHVTLSTSINIHKLGKSVWIMKVGRSVDEH